VFVRCSPLEWLENLAQQAAVVDIGNDVAVRIAAGIQPAAGIVGLGDEARAVGPDPVAVVVGDRVVRAVAFAADIDTKLVVILINE
jgi:hypothetical protein